MLPEMKPSRSHHLVPLPRWMLIPPLVPLHHSWKEEDRKSEEPMAHDKVAAPIVLQVSKKEVVVPLTEENTQK